MKFLMKNALFISTILFIHFCSCQSPQVQEVPGPDLDQLRTQLQELENSYADGQNSKNVDAIMSFYAENAKSLPVNKPMVEGSAAIRSLIQEQMDLDTIGSTVRFEVVDIMADGNMVVEVGKSISTSPDGSTTTGKYVAIYENRNGKLTCVLDIWNNDAPSGQ